VRATKNPKTTAKAAASSAERERKKWIAALQALIDEVEAWATARHWAVHRNQKRIHESRLGTYAAPVLSILAPTGKVQLDPVARDVIGADGRVDLFAWPSLTRIVLVRVGDKWVLKTDTGARFPQRWNRQTFERVVNLLNAAA
jgi:hypothetical protein